MTHTVTARPFRFGVVAGRTTDAAAWTRLAQRTENLGFTTLFVPDRPGMVLSVVPALAAAAAVTERLRVGPYVLAAGSRAATDAAAADVVAEMATLDLLSGGRLEIGVGAGLAPVAPVARVRALLEALRSPAPGSYPPPAATPPPLIVAAGGPRMLALAAELADVVALASRDLSEAGVSTPVATLAELGGAPELLLALQTVVGPGAAPDPGVVHRLRSMFGTTVEELVAADSPFVLAGTVEQRCDRLLRLRERYGISYVTVPDDAAEALAPVVERLTAR